MAKILRTQIRIPADVGNLIKIKASENDRSFNGELTARLKASLKADERAEKGETA